MNCTFVFACDNGLVCIPNTFVHISFGWHLKNNVGFCNVHFNAKMYVFSFKHMLVKILSKKMFSPNPILTRCLYIVVVI